MSKRGADDDGFGIEASEMKPVSPALSESNAMDKVKDGNEDAAVNNLPNNAAVDPNIVDWETIPQIHATGQKESKC